ncbi:hypothetical protein ACHAWF_006971 [Thalassiosira exigua]
MTNYCCMLQVLERHCGTTHQQIISKSQNMDFVPDDNGNRSGVKMKSIRRESFIETFGIKEAEEEANSSDDEDDFVRRMSLSVSDMDLHMDDVDTSQEPQDSKDEKSSSQSSAPNFAGGSARRKGDKHRRLHQRFGVFDTSEGRRASTGECSFGDSFGDMSLQSFTSINSFSSTGGSDGVKDINVEVGNLIFVTDDEMATLMYGGDTDSASSSGLSSSSSSVQNPASFDLSKSLPPSAMLGVGAFSTVRLAWRKTPEDSQQTDASQMDNAAEAFPSASFQGTGPCGANRQQRRSIVRVKSKDSNGNAPLETKGELVAVKIMQKSILKQMKTYQKGPDNRLTVLTAFDNIEREIASMKRLQHPNLVRLFEVIDSVESDRLHMVLEYVRLGEILSHVEGTNKYMRMRYRKKVKGLTEGGYFDEKHAALYFVDILHGLAYLHRNRICHRDLKPAENILLCTSGIAKISDFGVAHIFEEEKSHESFMVTALNDDDIDDMSSELKTGDFLHGDDGDGDSPTHLSKRESDVALNMASRYNRGILKKSEGTYPFWSPEMCSTDSEGFSAYAADIWAAGVCLYIFTTGVLPFFSLIPTELFDSISKAQVQYEGLDLSNELRDILGKLLEKDVSKRAGVGDCLKHKFCESARKQRMTELGTKFIYNEEHIILSKNDVDLALSITMPRKRPVRKKLSKRISAPAVTASITDAPPPSLGHPQKLERKLGQNPAQSSMKRMAPVTQNNSEHKTVPGRNIPTKKGLTSKWKKMTKWFTQEKG